MGNLLLMVVVGLAVGIFVISLGGGSGAIYLGALTAIFQLSPGAAAATSIVTSLPALIMGSWSYYRRRLINFRLGNRMLIAAIPSIFVGSFISPWLPERVYKLVIGLILIFLGVQLIVKLYRQPKAGHQSRLSPETASVLYGIMGGLMVGIAGLIAGSLVGAFLAPPIVLWMTAKPARARIVKLFMGAFIIVMGLRTAL